MLVVDRSTPPPRRERPGLFDTLSDRLQDVFAKLRAEQAEWLTQRDACGRDEACLADSMRDRIDGLMQD